MNGLSLFSFIYNPQNPKDKMNEKEMQSFREVNREMRDMMSNLADIMLTADADQWGHRLDYFPCDLMSATFIFMHTLSNIGIKNGTLDEQKSEEAGHRLRDLAKFMTGYDTADIAAHMKPEQEETAN